MRFAGLVFFLCLDAVQAQRQHGTIGFGINMYHPWCCTPCADVLSMLYLNCTTFSTDSHKGPGMDMKKRSMHMSMEGETSDECYATNQPFQQSLAFCIKAHCDIDGLSYEEQNECFQSKNYAGPLGPSLQQSLPAQAPKQMLAEEAMWLNATMLINEISYNIDRATISLFEESEVNHIMWSIAILVLSTAIPLLTGLYLLLTSQLPTWRRLDGGLTHAFHTYIALPAFGSKRRSEPIRWVGYLPSRAMTLWIALYIILNIFACSLGYRSVQPSTYFDNRNSELAAYVANRTGVLSFANMALAILFATRNNPLLYLSGWDMTTQITFHRWSARVAILQAIIHSIVYTADYVSYKGENTLSTEAAETYWWWGIIATIAMSLMAGFSAFPVRAKVYEFFLISHIILGILSLVGCWYHIIERFETKWGYEVWLYIAFSVWAYDRLVRVGSVVFQSIFRRPVAQLELVEGTNAGLMTVRLRKSLRPGPGKHTYVYFPSSGRFWENHPFTICGWDDYALMKRQMTGGNNTHDVERTNRDGSGSRRSSDVIGEKDHSTNAVKEVTVSQSSPNHQADESYIRCLFRLHKGMTSKVRSKLEPGQILTLPVAIEGTYGGHRTSHIALQSADTVLCIAGGIGITYATGFAQQFARDSISRPSPSKRMMSRCSRFVLAWSAREKELLDFCQKSLLPSVRDLDDGSMQYRFFHTGSDSETVSDKGKELENSRDLVQWHDGRMNVADVIRDVLRPQKRTVVLVCGPGSLSDEVRAQVVRYSREGHVIDLIAEDFAW